MDKKIKKIAISILCALISLGVLIYLIITLSNTGRTDRSIDISTDQLIAVAEGNGAVRIDDPAEFESVINDLWDNSENGEFSYYIELNDYDTRSLTYDLFYTSNINPTQRSPYYPAPVNTTMEDAVVYISLIRSNGDHQSTNYGFVSAIAVNYGSTLTASRLFSYMTRHIVGHSKHLHRGMDYLVFDSNNTIYGIYRDRSTIYYICGSCLPATDREIYRDFLNDLCEQLGIESPFELIHR